MIFENMSQNQNLNTDSAQSSVRPLELDPFLLSALNSQRDRMTILKLDKQLEQFMRNPDATHLEFPPMNGYQRMIVHKVAHYFGLMHTYDRLKKSVTVFKQEMSRIPVLRFNDLAEQPDDRSAVVKLLMKPLGREEKIKEDDYVLGGEQKRFLKKYSGFEGSFKNQESIPEFIPSATMYPELAPAVWASVPGGELASPGLPAFSDSPNAPSPALTPTSSPATESPESSSPPVVSPQMTLLASRPKTQLNSNLTILKPTTGAPNELGILKKPSPNVVQKSIEEREVAYAKARARIFEEKGEEGEGDDKKKEMTLEDLFELPDDDFGVCDIPSSSSSSSHSKGSSPSLSPKSSRSNEGSEGSENSPPTTSFATIGIDSQDTKSGQLGDLAALNSDFNSLGLSDTQPNPTNSNTRDKKQSNSPKQDTEAEQNQEGEGKPQDRSKNQNNNPKVLPPQNNRQTYKKPPPTNPPLRLNRPGPAQPILQPMMAPTLVPSPRTAQKQYQNPYSHPYPPMIPGMVQHIPGHVLPPYSAPVLLPRPPSVLWTGPPNSNQYNRDKGKRKGLGGNSGGTTPRNEKGQETGGIQPQIFPSLQNSDQNEEKIKINENNIPMDQNNVDYKTKFSKDSTQDFPSFTSQTRPNEYKQQQYSPVYPHRSAPSRHPSQPPHSSLPPDYHWPSHPYPPNNVPYTYPHVYDYPSYLVYDDSPNDLPSPDDNPYYPYPMETRNQPLYTSPRYSSYSPDPLYPPQSLYHPHMAHLPNVSLGNNQSHYYPPQPNLYMKQGDVNWMVPPPSMNLPPLRDIQPNNPGLSVARQLGTGISVMELPSRDNTASQPEHILEIEYCLPAKKAQLFESLKKRGATIKELDTGEKTVAIFRTVAAAKEVLQTFVSKDYSIKAFVVPIGSGYESFTSNKGPRGQQNSSKVKDGEMETDTTGPSNDNPQNLNETFQYQYPFPSSSSAQSNQETQICTIGNAS
eukprot:TRINITY_DN6039_c1_g1_i3.p1 TRINITY_DN6039_c1_g1~~TRINITY_DN6039_c1_g1_i3.p1  ORF type:complete len:968 (-),score=262.21 TRINITY_DN6039_c1_g1_i3:2-2905(-)